MHPIQLVVFGSGGVGKSALTIQFVQGLFIEFYDPTIEDCFRRALQVDGQPCLLEIIDTAGTEQFTALYDMYMKRGEGFLLVYSVTSKGSLEDLEERREQILHIKGSTDPAATVPIVLIGNKTDIIHEREVSTDEGRRLAAEWRCPFLETSAKTAENVDEAFFSLVREVRLASGMHGSGTSSRAHGRGRRRKCVIL
ncbi:ras-related protein Rap-1b precursor [Thamnocephalis sphaerospora]|uniref:small monomeric GTPase n=1 Tax=Thamnocephalis sphaerospora TaxID=78915 RepID=A0A4P9XU68_9FUNG|nr:ras-related protein Rap-1b precursor [Thamnocephalis sphaerospora]|eukprot:RKP09736.1 ras-related protein Rap-1b precursor [Thamnocephalis sphaerospora]